MNLTDAKVARALGWTRKKAHSFGSRPNMAWLSPEGMFNGQEIPSYTTSFEVVIAVLASRHLSYTIKQISVLPADAQVFDLVTAGVSNAKVYRAKTAPLALCEALLAYLKEKK